MFFRHLFKCWSKNVSTSNAKLSTFHRERTFLRTMVKFSRGFNCARLSCFVLERMERMSRENFHWAARYSPLSTTLRERLRRRRHVYCWTLADERKNGECNKVQGLLLFGFIEGRNLLRVRRHQKTRALLSVRTFLLFQRQGHLIWKAVETIERDLFFLTSCFFFIIWL